VALCVRQAPEVVVQRGEVLRIGVGSRFEDRPRPTVCLRRIVKAAQVLGRHAEVVVELGDLDAVGTEGARGAG